MDSQPALLVVFILMGVVVPLILRMAIRRRKRDLAQTQKEIEGVPEPIAMDEEALAQNQRSVEQSGETTAQLNAIKENLEHRSIKN